MTVQKLLIYSWRSGPQTCLKTHFKFPPYSFWTYHTTSDVQQPEAFLLCSHYAWIWFILLPRPGAAHAPLCFWCFLGACCDNALHLGDGLRLRPLWVRCSLWVSVLPPLMIQMLCVIQLFFSSVLNWVCFLPQGPGQQVLCVSSVPGQEWEPGCQEEVSGHAHKLSVSL